MVLKKLTVIPSTLYLISYDLRAPGRNYDDLTPFLRNELEATKVLKSVWIVRSNSSSESLKGSIRRFIDGNDGLLVMPLENSRLVHAAYQNLETDLELL